MGKKATRETEQDAERGHVEVVAEELRRLMPDGVSATGRVEQLYPDRNGCYISLRGANPQPLNGLFQIQLTHPNYNALYSLALAAAVNGLTLTIRTQEVIKPTERALVEYLKQTF